jgi:hypothetical protein
MQIARCSTERIAARGIDVARPRGSVDQARVGNRATGLGGERER